MVIFLSRASEKGVAMGIYVILFSSPGYCISLELPYEVLKNSYSVQNSWAAPRYTSIHKDL